MEDFQPSKKAASLGAYIKKQAKEKKISRKRLASSLEVSQAEIELIEKGERLLTFTQITVLSTLFEVPLEKMLKECGIWG